MHPEPIVLPLKSTMLAVHPDLASTDVAHTRARAMCWTIVRTMIFDFLLALQDTKRGDIELGYQIALDRLLSLGAGGELVDGENRIALDVSDS
jgi:hypothetical protein